MSTTSSPNVIWLYVMGILTALMGSVAIASPLVAGTAIMYIVGAVMLVAGIGQVASAFRANDLWHKLLPLVLGVVTVIAGLMVLFHPLVGLELLTLFLAAYFIASGIWKIVVSFNYRPAQGWIGLLLSGVVNWVLGAMIFMLWPASGLWVIGIIVGVDLVLTGVAMIFLGMTIDKVAHEPEGPSDSGSDSDQAAHA